MNATTYKPGYALPKLAIIILGSVMVIFGFSQIFTPLLLIFTGGQAHAEATRVIKSKPGLPDLVLSNDVDIHAQHESQDRSYTFWNEFRFQDAGGAKHVVRSSVGSQLKPLYPLVDEDGLPTSLSIHYDLMNPEVVVFPGIYSTWFAPGVLIVIGLGLTIIGSFLFYWSGKPIEIPHFAPNPEPPVAEPVIEIPVEPPGAN